MASRRSRVAGAVAVGVLVALIGAGCGSATSSVNESASTIATTPDTEVTAPVDPGWPTPTAAALGVTVDAACPMPWAPVYVERTQYQGAHTTTGKKPEPSDPPVNGLDATSDPKVDLSARWVSSHRAASDEAGYITLGHGANATVLGAPGRVVGWPGGRTWIGDLDGDGRDEVAVMSTTGSGDPPPQPIVIVPGTVAAGSQDPLAVGVRLPVDAGQGQSVLGVGDVDGDGADDVALFDGTRQAVVSGRDLMAPGPGGRLNRVPSPIAVVPTGVLGWLALAPGTTPVVGQVTDGSLDLLTTPRISLKLDGDAPFGPSAALSAYLSAGHRIVVLASDNGRSGLSEQQMWDLDAPCGGAH